MTQWVLKYGCDGIEDGKGKAFHSTSYSSRSAIQNVSALQATAP